MESMNGVAISIGQTVWCEEAIGFEHCGKCFKAKVIEGHREPQHGMVWVRELATPANPVEDGGWVTEWAAKKIFAP